MRAKGPVLASEEVTLGVATAEKTTLLTNLLEFYLHDLSEIFPIRGERRRPVRV